MKKCVVKGVEYELVPASEEEQASKELCCGCAFEGNIEDCLGCPDDCEEHSDSVWKPVETVEVLPEAMSV